MMKAIFLALLLCTAWAQTPDNPGSGLIPGLPPGPAPVAEEIEPRTWEISSRLRCPVCQGLSVAASTSEAAVMFQRRIRELVTMGYSDEQIYDYFEDGYGEWILLEPRVEGLNWLLWLAPGLGLGLGLAYASSVVATWRREPDDVPLPSDVGLVAKDRYEERLLAELEE